MNAATILIVEDDRIVARDIQNRLTLLGYSVVGVTRFGEEAIQLAAQLHPDLVLMDIRLEGAMDGVTAAQEIRNHLHLPIIYLTAYADEETLDRARVTEPFGYLLKPFEERELRTAIEMALYKHQAERKLRESERRYAVTLSSIGDAVIATDSQTRIEFLNPAAAKLTGWHPEEGVGQPLHEVFRIINEQTRQPAENPVAKILREGKVIGLANHTKLLSRDGREIPIEDCGAPIIDDKGRITGSVLVFHDVSERRRLQEQFLQAQKMEAVGRLAGGVAHDFNNILTIINGYSQLVFDSINPDDPNRQLLAEVLKCGERAAKLTRQLLAFSRKQMLQPQVVSLNALLTDLLKMLARLIGEDVELDFVPDPALGLAKVDPGQFEQAIINLAVNARDAMPHGGRLILETHNAELDADYAEHHPDVRPGNYVCVSVSDTGHGMDEAIKANIFEPFFTTKGLGKGTGLGLAMVYGFVKQSEGHIEVFSEPGQGTMFRVYLPRAVETTPSPKSSAEHPTIPKGTETVLLVEDEDAVRSLSKIVLKACGYTVLEAGDGQEAVSIAQQHQGSIDLLLTDLVMPRMSGHQLAELLVQTRPHLRILFMSGYTDEAIRGHGQDQATVALLEKPFAPINLARKVREVLDAEKNR
ncbi:MAG TPA: response regulator [Gemmataceae bacterium]|nr:response regulator [Gemmataceae bacterium]